MSAASVFFQLHEGLEQQAPGSDECTRRALTLVPNLQLAPAVLDVGCGPGRQSITLARETGGFVAAVDLHAPFLIQLRRRTRDEGLDDRIAPVRSSMTALPFERDEFDLVWSEGAIYVMGFKNGLKEWKRYLRPGGTMAVSELSWLSSTPDSELKTFWDGAYPAMKTMAENQRIVAETGYRLVGTFVLPESAWWDGYYTPLGKRLGHLREVYRNDPEAMAVLDETGDEIETYRRYAASYGYVFYLMTKPATGAT